MFDEINSYNRRVAKGNDNKNTLALAVTVDDLDRCSHEKIMEMLTATHLLLEQRDAPMAIFLAVDPQLITSAIVGSGAVENKVALQGESLRVRVCVLQKLTCVVTTPFTYNISWVRLFSSTPTLITQVSRRRYATLRAKLFSKVKHGVSGMRQTAQLGYLEMNNRF